MRVEEEARVNRDMEASLPPTLALMTANPNLIPEIRL